MSGLPSHSHYPAPIVAIPYHHKVPAMPRGLRNSVPMVSRPSHLRTMTSLEIPPSHQNTITSTVPHVKEVTQGYKNTITSTGSHVKISKLVEPPLHQNTSSPLPPTTPKPSTLSIPSPPRSNLLGHGTSPTNQHQPASYSLTIHPLLSLQHQIQHPSFPTSYPSPPTIHHHQRHLYTQLQSLFSKMKRELLTTFYLRIQCPRCGQLPIIADWEYNGRGLGGMNHALPREALLLWRTLRREIEVEGVDLLRLRQGHLDGVVGGLREVERVFFEGDVGGCGVEAWNGGHGGPPMD